MTTDNLTRSHRSFAAFSSINYRLFFSGNVLSMLGRQMLLVALGWDIYDKTHSALMLGYIGLAEIIPVLLLTLLAGQVADNHKCKTIILLTQGLFALAILGITIVSMGHLPLMWIYAMLFLFGCAKSFSSPANSTILPRIIPQDILTNALTWNTMTFQIASIFGPVMAGLLIYWTKSAVIVYALASLFAFIFMLLVSRVVETPLETQEKKNITFSSLSAGLRYVRDKKVILAAITLDLFAVLLGGAVTLLPIFARDILHCGPVGLGVLQASTSLGSCSMAVFLTRTPIHRQAGPILLGCVTGFGLATIGFGLSKFFWLSFLMLFVAGALDNVSMVVRAMLIQYQTPRNLLGRVSAINYMFIGTSNELGGFESGLVAHYLGPVLATVLGGMGTVLVVLGVTLLWPQMRRLDEIENLNNPPPQ